MEGKGKRTIRRFQRPKSQNFRKAVLVLVLVPVYLADELLLKWELVWVQLVSEWWREGECCHCRRRRHSKGGRHHHRCYRQ